MTPTIVLTGGGTAGHVTPNLALVAGLRERGMHVEYIGSEAGMERGLVERAGLPYHGVAVGKLRRYASWQNLIDPFRMLLGAAQAWRVLGRLRPRVIFSKGGFVGVPVVLAAWLRRIPVVLHESDLSPGLANRLCLPLATRVCVAQEETLRLLPERVRALHTGSPIRPEMLAGERKRGLARFGLEADRPIALVFGGSSGARALNDAVRELIRGGELELQVLHVCGAGNLEGSLDNRPGYRQYEYLSEEFPDALACADVVVTRGGANSLTELVALRKPAIVVPLPAVASRGDQLENARRYAERGYGTVLPQEELTPARLRAELLATLQNAEHFIEAMGADPAGDAVTTIIDLLGEIAGADS